MESDESRKVFADERAKSVLAAQKAEKRSFQDNKKFNFTKFMLISIGLIVLFVLIKLITIATQQPKYNQPRQTVEQTAPIPAQPIGTGKITTIADGFDVRRVNLFSTTGPNRTINASLIDGEKVNILRDEDPYYFVETSNGDGRRGYCIKGFVIKTK